MDLTVDETYVGGKPRYSRNPRKEWSTKQPVVALIECGGRVKARVVADVTAKTLQAAIRENVDLQSHLMTDEWSAYRLIGKEFAGHKTVRHSTWEYARGDAHINTAESFFSLVKRSLNGIYHADNHLHYVIHVFVGDARWLKSRVKPSANHLHPGLWAA